MGMWCTYIKAIGLGLDDGQIKQGTSSLHGGHTWHIWHGARAMGLGPQLGEKGVLAPPPLRAKVKEEGPPSQGVTRFALSLSLSS